jgi:hypothetical protein
MNVPVFIDISLEEQVSLESDNVTKNTQLNSNDPLG